MQRVYERRERTQCHCVKIIRFAIFAVDEYCQTSKIPFHSLQFWSAPAFVHFIYQQRQWQWRQTRRERTSTRDTQQRERERVSINWRTRTNGNKTATATTTQKRTTQLNVCFIVIFCVRHIVPLRFHFCDVFSLPFVKWQLCEKMSEYDSRFIIGQIHNSTNKWMHV